jgi:hypothetical protein
LARAHEECDRGRILWIMFDPRDPNPRACYRFTQIKVILQHLNGNKNSGLCAHPIPLLKTPGYVLITNITLLTTECQPETQMMDSKGFPEATLADLRRSNKNRPVCAIFVIPNF